MLTEIVESSASLPVVAPAETGEPRTDPRTDQARRTQKHSDVPVLGRDTQANKTNWVTTGFMVAFHLLAVAALFMFTWKAFFCFLGLWLVAINMGIGMGITVCLRIAATGRPSGWSTSFPSAARWRWREDRSSG